MKYLAISLLTVVVYTMLDTFTAVACTKVSNPVCKLAVMFVGVLPHTPADMLAASLTWLDSSCKER